jgi:hypothetical protein
MGLLDALMGSGPEDPRSQQFGLLMQGLAQRNGVGGLLAANQYAAQAPDRKRALEMEQMKMEQVRMAMDKAKRDQLMEQQFSDAARSAYRTPEQANGMNMGPTPEGGQPPSFQPGFDPQAFLQRAYGIDPMKAMQFEQSLAKDDKPITVAPGASLVSPKTFKSVFTAPDKADKPPAAIQEYQFAQQQGYKGTFDQWDKDRKKAGASSVSVSVSAEKNLLNDLAGGLGKSMVSAKEGAQAALGTINTVNRLNDALDSGKTMAGPGTTFRQFGLQVGNLLGVSGKDANEKMLNTRQAIQSLAQLELDAAQQMKGQGQITEAERAIIRRAASGDIDGMTTGELRLLGGVLDRTARFKIRGYNQQVAPLKKNPNAAPLAPFLDVAEPEMRNPGGAKFLGFE